MQAIILYQTKYGATRQYAEWLGEDLGLQVLSVAKAKAKDWQGCETVILGSSAHMFHLIIRGWLAKHWSGLAGKKVYLFTVSAAPAGSETLAKVMQESIPPAMAGKFEHFPLPGRIRLSDLSPLMRWFFKMGANAARKKQAGDQSQAQDTPLQEFDFVKRENLAPLEAALKKAL